MKWLTGQITEKALLDGIYVLRTAEPSSRIGEAAVARAYKQLKLNERAFRQMKTRTLSPADPVAPATGRRVLSRACWDRA